MESECNPLNTPGIIPIPIGGLGNQMFIIAAAYTVHKTISAPLYILNHNTKYNKHSKLNYNETIFKHLGIRVNEDDHDTAYLHTLKYTKFSPSGFKNWNPSELKPGVIMSSYFQYYPPLKIYESEIRELFIKGLDSYIKNLSKDYSSYAFLHVRRGDYLENPNIHYIQPIEYYEKASNDLSKILIISDDMSWIKQQDFFKNDKFELFQSENELETLAVMTMCKSGAICANSTFSWWGAFLGAHENRSPVYIPKKWISDPIVSLFPEEWIII